MKNFFKSVKEYIKEHKINSAIIALVILFAIIQILEIHFLSVEQDSDFKLYVDYARKVINTGHIYPDHSEVYSNWIIAPGYINFLALLLLIFKNNLRHVMYFNVVMNLILLFEVYFLASKVGNKKIGKIAVVLFCIFATNYAEILFTGTELIFVVLAYGALCLFLKDDYKYYLISGILLGIANWTRALMLPFIVVMVLFFIFKKKNYKKLVTFFLGLLIACSTIGLATYKNFGYFSFQSITTGPNLLMGANDDAKGNFNDSILSPGGAGYSARNNPKLTVKQRNKFWTNEAVDWIEKHPVKYIGLMPAKLYYMYKEDYSLVYKLATSDFGFVYRGLGKNYTLYRFFMRVFGVLTNQLHFLYYAFLMISSIVGTVLAVLKKEHKFLIFSGIVFFITGFTILLVGHDRYHYPCMYPVMILVAYSIDYLYTKHKNKDMIFY